MDLLLDRNTHDITLDGYDLAIVSGVDLIRQRIKQRLLLIQGEWFLAIDDGLPWFSELNQKGITEDRVRALLTSQITETEGVAEMLEFNIDYNGATRSMLLQFRVSLNDGATIDVSQTV